MWCTCVAGSCSTCTCILPAREHSRKRSFHGTCGGGQRVQWNTAQLFVCWLQLRGGRDQLSAGPWGRLLAVLQEKRHIDSPGTNVTMRRYTVSAERNSEAGPLGMVNSIATGPGQVGHTPSWRWVGLMRPPGRHVCAERFASHRIETNGNVTRRAGALTLPPGASQSGRYMYREVGGCGPAGGAQG
jgi:hypothetical protein